MEEAVKKGILRCETCSQVYPSLRALSAHRRAHDRKECALCKAVFADDKALKDHKKYHKLTSNTCSICKKVFSDGSLKAHLLSHQRKGQDQLTSDPKAVPCQICSKTFRTPLDLAMHLRVHKGRHMCQIPSCKRYFGSLGALKDHEASHNLTCDFCSKSFPLGSEAELAKHMEEEREFFAFSVLCELCGEGFTTSKLLSRHKRSVHGGQLFVCEICGKSFASNSNLTSHQRAHQDDPKPFGCDLCGEKFGQKISLQKHMRIHTGQMPYPCDKCSKGFTYIQGLRRHLVKHHPPTSSDRHLCQRCYKTFSTPAELAKHSKSHKDLKCKICDKDFDCKSHLKEHLLTHSQVKPYRCPHCPKGFLRAAPLRQHMQKEHPNVAPELEEVLVQIEIDGL